NVHTPGQLHPVAQPRIELPLERLLVVGEVGPHVPLTLAADALGECPADRRDGEEKQRAASEQEDDRENALDIHDQRGGAGRSVAPMTNTRPITPTAGANAPIGRFPPARELTDLVPDRQRLAQELP